MAALLGAGAGTVAGSRRIGLGSLRLVLLIRPGRLPAEPALDHVVRDDHEEGPQLAMPLGLHLPEDELQLVGREGDGERPNGLNEGQRPDPKVTDSLSIDQPNDWTRLVADVLDL